MKGRLDLIYLMKGYLVKFASVKHSVLNHILNFTYDSVKFKIYLNRTGFYLFGPHFVLYQSLNRLPI